MTTNCKLAGGTAKRSLVPRNWARPPGLALLGLALIGLVQAGCRSGGCSDCNLGSKISNGVQALTARVTKHFDGCGGGADCGCGGETVVDSAVPIYSGGMVVPGPGSGTIIQSPAVDQPPTQLDPIPSNAQPMSGTTTNPSSTRSTPATGNTRSSYTTMAPKGATAQRRGTDVSRALHSSPENASSPDPLDNLPPVDLPSEVTKNATATVKPAQSVVTPTPPVAPAATPAAEATAPPITPGSTTPPPAEKVSAAEGAVGGIPVIETTSPFSAPGIRRYASIAPALAGGSVPSIEGLDWLKEKGCRTFIDLRKSSEVEPNFVDAVNDRNMVYISLPILANRLDSSRLARFDDLVTPADNRPLYFCDSDGTRAGLVWYIHLRSVVQEDSQSAAGKAEEIGLTDVEVKLAEAYLATNKPRPRVSTARVAMATLPEARPEPKVESAPAIAVAPVKSPATAPEAAPRPALPGGSTSSDAAKPDSVPAPSTDPTPSMLPGEHKPQASNGRYRDPSFWRPIAALVLTGIGVPLAYWSRSAFSVSRSTRARASLPGAVQPPSDAPAGLDA